MRLKYCFTLVVRKDIFCKKINPMYSVYKITLTSLLLFINTRLTSFIFMEKSSLNTENIIIWISEILEMARSTDNQ